MVSDELFVYWTRRRNLFDGPPCATNPYASRATVAIQHVFRDQDDSHLWRVQEQRQQRLAREAGRIGYMGNAGPSVGFIAAFFLSLNVRFQGACGR